MMDFIGSYYLWFKALHIIAVMSWMAGMLYLPRLFVYHADCQQGSETSETFKTMERRLLRFIMNPAMIIAWIMGLMMIGANPELMKQGWMHGKMACIIIMTIIHMIFSRWRRVFEADKNEKTAKFYKIWNEVPTTLMVIVVILAVAEPF